MKKEPDKYFGRAQHWKSVRRSDKISVRNDQLQELEKRLAAVNADLSIALTPLQARALLKK